MGKRNISEYQRDICGVFMSENQNRSNYEDESGEMMVLCGLHHETASAVSQDGPFNWLAIRLSSASLEELRPDINTNPDEFVEWDPLGKSIELYRQYAADPEVQADWEEICHIAREDKDQ